MGFLMDVSVTAEQAAVCARFGVEPSGVLPEQKVGIARNVLDGLVPVNGLRHKPEGDTSGWYIWAGEQLSDDPDFFLPLHVEHLAGWCPAAIPYLALPPGWRFLVAPGHEDAWHDQSLLQV
jgi:hypothetical protein